MSPRKILQASFLILAGCFFVAGCSKKFSSDAPLTPTYNASVYIGGDNHILYAIDPVTGLKNWEFSMSAPITASPLVYNERVYVGSNHSGTVYGDTLYKLDAQTGTVLNSFHPALTSFYIIATPTADANLIYLACTNNTIYALDTGTFNVVWYANTSGAIESSPVVFNGYVFFGCFDGNLYCYNKTTGAVPSVGGWPWNPVTAGVSTTTEQFYSSAAIGVDSNSGPPDTVLCIGGTDKMYCLKLSFQTSIPSIIGPTVKWTYPTTGVVNSSPTIYGGACVFGCDDDNVYCVDIESGHQRWPKFFTGGSVQSSPYAYNGVIYVGANSNNLYAINFSNGTQKWVFYSAGMIKSSPVVYGSYVYFGSYDKSFYAIDTALGQKKWSFVINNNIESSPVVDYNSGGFGVMSSISGLLN